MEGVRRRLLWAGTCLVALMPLAHSQLPVGESCTVLWDGSPGICRLISNCPWAAAQLQSKIRPTICSFSGLESVVCCKSNIFNSNGPRPTTVRSAPNFQASSVRESSQEPRRGRRISLRKCDEYRSLVTAEVEALPLIPGFGVLKSIVPNCVQHQTDIDAKWYQAHAGQFPHTVAVGYASSRASGIQWACAGTLISDRYVMTSAHCTYSEEYKSAASVCRIGAHNLLRRELTALDVNVAKIVQHPGSTSANRYDDIALLQLERTIAFSVTVRPACLWQRSDFNGSKATVSGWANITYSEQRSEVLMHAQMDLLEPARCSERIRPSWKIPRGVIGKQLCAENVNRDTCTGQNGGPLTVTADDIPCLFYLVGITSLGSECGSNSPGVFTRISDYLPWIEREVWQNS